jgi:hypothetical protein
MRCLKHSDNTLVTSVDPLNDPQLPKDATLALVIYQIGELRTDLKEGLDRIHARLDHSDARLQQLENRMLTLELWQKAQPTAGEIPTWMKVAIAILTLIGTAVAIVAGVGGVG